MEMQIKLTASLSSYCFKTNKQSPGLCRSEDICVKRVSESKIRLFFHVLRQWYVYPLLYEFPDLSNSSVPGNENLNHIYTL